MTIMLFYVRVSIRHDQKDEHSINHKTSLAVFLPHCHTDCLPLTITA